MRSPADDNDMGRVTASIVAGIVVGILAGVAASSFLMAATWSSIHGGMSEITVAVLSVVAMALPPVCGFLAGRAMYRWWPRRVATEMTDSSSSTSRGHHATSITSTPLTCPHCGCLLEHPADYAVTPPYTLVECRSTGRFTWAPGLPSRLGGRRKSERDHSPTLSSLDVRNSLPCTQTLGRHCPDYYE
jgi:hypothetical protein